MTRPSLLAVAAGVLTAAIALVVHPATAGVAVIVTAVVHAIVWSRANASASFAGIACGLATGLVLLRLPASLLASDRFAGGASVGVSVIVLPACAVVTTLAVLGVRAIGQTR